MTRSPLAHAFIPAPNVEPRRNGRTVDMLVLHYTGMATSDLAVKQLCSATSGVSCHYLVDSDGRILQMVGEEMRAWHAGASCWGGETDTNSRSIGIEIHNPGHWIDYADFGEVQMAAVVELCRDILSRHDIPACNVLAHSDVAPMRKIDPGEKFDWKGLAEAGVGRWIMPAPIEEDGWSLGPGARSERIADAQHLLRSYGYGIEVTGLLDTVTVFVLRAFQLHWRPARIDSRLDHSTLETLRRLQATAQGDTAAS